MKYAAMGLVLATSALLVGCDKIQEKLAQKAAEKAVESASGGSVAINNGTSGGVTVTDPSTGATAVSGATVKLPAGWPANVPIYPGAAIRNALTSPSGKTVTLATNGRACEGRRLLQDEVGAQGRERLGSRPAAHPHVQERQGHGTVTVGQAGADTMVTIAAID